MVHIRFLFGVFYSCYVRTKKLYYFGISGCHLTNKLCMVTLDRNYLGQGNVDKFDAIVYKVRYFRSNDVSIFYTCFHECMLNENKKKSNCYTNYKLFIPK